MKEYFNKHGISMKYVRCIKFIKEMLYSLRVLSYLNPYAINSRLLGVPLQEFILFIDDTTYNTYVS